MSSELLQKIGIPVFCVVLLGCPMPEQRAAEIQFPLRVTSIGIRNETGRLIQQTRIRSGSFGETCGVIGSEATAELHYSTLARRPKLAPQVSIEWTSEDGVPHQAEVDLQKLAGVELHRDGSVLFCINSAGKLTVETEK